MGSPVGSLLRVRLTALRPRNTLIHYYGPADAIVKPVPFFLSREFHPASAG